MIDVSLICPTYSRPHLIVEAIESYRRQDFTGTSELLICNDNPHQELHCDVPGVRIFNIKTRFKTLGEKYNWMFNEARGEYLAPWEDDDVFLKHRVSSSVAVMEADGLDYYKVPYAYFFNSGNITGITSNLFFCAGMWKKSLFLRTQGCSAVNTEADRTIESELGVVCDPDKYFIDREALNCQVFYCYMWGGRTYHLSGYGCGADVLERAQKDLEKNMVRGKIDLVPSWEIDYEQMCSEHREI